MRKKVWEFYDDQDEPCAYCAYGNNGRCGAYKGCDDYQNYHDTETGTKNTEQQVQPSKKLPVCWNENCEKWNEDICMSPEKCINDEQGGSNERRN